MSEQTHIVIIGAGYGGLMCAIRLAGRNRRQNTRITLVNGSENFVERIRLHETATNQPPRTHHIPHMLRGTGVQFLQGWVTEIHPEKQSVQVKTIADGETTITYDTLVYAVGSRVSQEAVPGVRDHAFVLNPNGLNNADDLRDRLEAAKQETLRVVVVGGGATGIEAAGEIHAQYPNFEVSLITKGQVGMFKGARVQPHFVDALTKQNIHIEEHRSVKEVQENALCFAGDETMPVDVCVWSGGFIAPALAQNAGLEVNQQRQVLVDLYLRSVSHPQIYAIGDAAFPRHDTGAPYRMSVFAAMVMGAHTADSITRHLRGKSPKPFAFSTYGQGIAVGKNDGVGFNTFPNDMPVGPLFRGRAAVKLRAFFVWFLLFAMELERRFPGFLFWFGKNRAKMNVTGTVLHHSENPVT